VLTPGFRLGYLIAPPELYPKLLQAKQAADLHTPGFNQRVVHEVIRNGFLDSHIPSIRALYKANRDAMAEALQAFLPPGCEWQSPQGGMFFWIRLPAGLDAMALLPQAVEAGIAYVPGAAFYAHQPDARTLRLSFVTLTPSLIKEGVEKLGRLLHESLSVAAETAP
jgi:2-aminoadipate transaminase